MTDKKRPKKNPTGDYETGYCKPPEKGRIKPGEVRNPHGRSGKPTAEADDPLGFALSRLTRITLDGEKMDVTTETAMHLQHVARAMAGDQRAYHTIMPALMKRRPAAAPAEKHDAAAEAEKTAQQEAIREKMIGIVEEYSRMKFELGQLRAARPAAPLTDDQS